MPDRDFTLLEGTYQLACIYYKEKKDWLKAMQWFALITRESPGYKDANTSLHFIVERLKQKEYNDGIKALHDKRWDIAHEHFTKLIDFNNEYPDPDNKYPDIMANLTRAEEGLKLPQLYASAKELLDDEQWSEAILKLEEIFKIDEKFQDSYAQLIRARRMREIAQKYQEAQKQFNFAKKQDEQREWKKAVDHLKEVKQVKSNYKDVNTLLKRAKHRLRLVTCYNKGSQSLDKEQWLRAVLYLCIASRLESSYKNIKHKLLQAWKGLRAQWREGPFGLTWKKLWRAAVVVVWTILVIIFTIAVALFPDDFAAIGGTLRENFGIGVSSTPTLTLPDINKIEILLDGNQINPDQLPNLASGKKVELEIIVFDTHGVRYMGKDLVCTWSVAPLSSKDIKIDTELCKISYIPSQAYSSQSVAVEVEGSEQQFKPSDPILMKFNIIR